MEAAFIDYKLRIITYISIIYTVKEPLYSVINFKFYNYIVRLSGALL
jgi:hypothetical protein